MILSLPAPRGEVVCRRRIGGGSWCLPRPAGEVACRLRRDGGGLQLVVLQQQQVSWLKKRQIPIACALIAIGVSLPGIAYGLAQFWVNWYHDHNEGVHQDMMVTAMLAWLLAALVGLIMIVFGMVCLITALIEKARKI